MLSIMNEIKRKRLIYLSSKRGIIENDYILGLFSREILSKLNNEEIILYEKLLQQPDQEIYEWITNKEENIKIPLELRSIINRISIFIDSRKKYENI